MARGDQITAVDYTTIRNKIVSILSTGTAQQGYGQSLYSIPVNPGTQITAEQWDALKIDISNVKLHQDGVLPPIIDVSPGQVISYSSGSPNTNYDTITELATLTKFNKPPLPAIVTSKGSASTSASWTTQLQATLTVTFNGGYTVTNRDATSFTASGSDHARHFFNSGGKIKFVSERTGLLDTPQNITWTNLLSSIGTQEFGAATPVITNFYTLTNSYQTFYQSGPASSYSSGYSDNSYKLEALCNCSGTDNSTGTANTITFRITWTDGHIPKFDGPDTVDGTFDIIVSEYKAAGILLQGGLFSIASANTYSLSAITAT